MLRTLASRTVALAPRAEAPVAYGVRFAHEGLKGYGDKERGEETVYFRKEEEKLLRSLLAKVKKQVEVHDAAGASAGAESEKESLDAIISKYKLSEEDKAALLTWKHESH